MIDTARPVLRGPPREIEDRAPVDVLRLERGAAREEQPHRADMPVARSPVKGRKGLMVLRARVDSFLQKKLDDLGATEKRSVNERLLQVLLLCFVPAGRRKALHEVESPHGGCRAHAVDSCAGRNERSEGGDAPVADGPHPWPAVVIDAGDLRAA